MPLQLAPALDERRSEIHRLDEPLAARDDLERAIALLEELHVVHDRPRLAEHRALLAQQLDHACAALVIDWPDELVVGLLCGRRVLRLPAGSPQVIGRSVPFG